MSRSILKSGSTPMPTPTPPSSGRRRQVWFEIDETEMRPSSEADAGSEMYEVALAAICSVALVLLLNQGILGTKLGIMGLILVAHWLILLLVTGMRNSTKAFSRLNIFSRWLRSS
ncbi:hypothetical protein F5Y15DRAFT_417778 [Xylariaceae sp. FL0016]|nr:hypothetical protein F5Y15DRAFT_417778 [Xylariaceae sp. FL0016]